MVTDRDLHDRILIGLKAPRPLAGHVLMTLVTVHTTAATYVPSPPPCERNGPKHLHSVTRYRAITVMSVDHPSAMSSRYDLYRRSDLSCRSQQQYKFSCFSSAYVEQTSNPITRLKETNTSSTPTYHLQSNNHVRCKQRSERRNQWRNQWRKRCERKRCATPRWGTRTSSQLPRVS